MQQSVYNPGHTAFGGGASGSLLHPVVLTALVAVAVLTFLLPRRYVIVPLLSLILLTPYGQNLYVGGAHLYIPRLLVLLGLARVLSMQRLDKRLPGGFKPLDKLFIAWALYRAGATLLQFVAVGAVVNQAAFLLDSLGAYFLFRRLIRDDADILTVVKVFAGAAAIMAVVMIREQMTGQNMFGLLGGINLISDLRNGRIRAQGPFQISIIAGSFGATIFPLCLWLWKKGSARTLAIIGAASAVVMTLMSASSTPLSALLACFVALCLWPLREQMRLIRWGIVAGLVGLQLVMKAPIWFVLSRIDFVGGSTGWDRAELIDMFVRHAGDWWLIGTHDNANWGWDMWDQCNQFVAEGESGGLVVLVCFVAMIVLCFKSIGGARRAIRGDLKKEWLFWLLGTTLFTQTMAYFGIDYFDQSKYFWYALLAMFSVTTRSAQSTFPDDSRKPMVPDSFWSISIPEGASTQIGDPQGVQRLCSYPS